MTVLELVGGKYDGVQLAMDVEKPPETIDVPAKGIPKNLSDVVRLLAEDPNTIRYEYRGWVDIGAIWGGRPNGERRYMYRLAGWKE